MTVYVLKSCDIFDHFDEIVGVYRSLENAKDALDYLKNLQESVKLLYKDLEEVEDSFMGDFYECQRKWLSARIEPWDLDDHIKESIINLQFEFLTYEIVPMPLL